MIWVYKACLWAYDASTMEARVDLPTCDYDGYIFDLDGTLVDSMKAHYVAWRECLLEAGAPESAFSLEEFYELGGVTAQDTVAIMNERYGLKMDGDVVALRKRFYYLRYLDRDGLEPIEEVVDFARSLLGRKPIAIGTGSALPGALRSLKAAGLEGLFDIIVTPDDVENGKPAPDIFLKAAELMGCDPRRCVVFEDAMPGMLAAEAAGMDCVVVRSHVAL